MATEIIVQDVSTDVSVQDGTSEVDVSVQGGTRLSGEEVEDIVGSLIVGGTNVTATYDDGADELTIDTTGISEEEVEDAAASLLTAGNAISVTYDDPNDTLTVGVDEAGLSFYDGTNINVAQITDADDGTTYDIGDDLAGGGGGADDSRVQMFARRNTTG